MDESEVDDVREPHTGRTGAGGRGHHNGRTGGADRSRRHRGEGAENIETGEPRTYWRTYLAGGALKKLQHAPEHPESPEQRGGTHTKGDKQSAARREGRRRREWREARKTVSVMLENIARARRT